MIIKRLTVKNFRNYEAQSVEFYSGLNVLSGANAQGKTNLLEAIYACCVGRSPRTPRDADLVRRGAEEGGVALVADKIGGDISVEMRFSRSIKKRVAINSLSVQRLGELMGAVNCVYFSPDELKIVKESPSDRRRFIDIDVCQMSKAYFYLLGRYNKILTQRNRLLKGGDDAALKSTLPVWDAQLAEAGARIILSRRKFIEKLKPLARDEHAYLTDGGENLEIEYESAEGDDLPSVTASLTRRLEAARGRDLKNGFTSEGPHKDDVRISANGADLRVFGSQGQQRTAALSLKLAELEIFSREIGEYPVLLLDDVLSELDLKRRARLLERAKKTQTLLTCTHFDGEAAGAAVFTVENGTVAERAGGGNAR